MKENTAKLNHGGTQHYAVALSGVKKTFTTKTISSRTPKTVHAVRGVDLTIKPGQVVAFLGPNGAGKTTTLDIILGLSEPTAGTVRVLGLSPREAITRGLVGATLQDGTLGPALNVRQTLDVLASLHSHPLPVDEVLARADLTELASRRVAKLSGGERQRLRLAAALLPDPSLLVLDEPTSGMDVTARAAFWETMHELARDGERTVLFATHYLAEASDFADRIVIMDHGKLIADGSIEQLRRHHHLTTVNASWADASDQDIRRQLGELLGDTAQGVESISIEEGTVSIRCRNSDAVARLLLTSSPASGLSITPASLDDLFTQLVHASENSSSQR